MADKLVYRGKICQFGLISTVIYWSVRSTSMRKWDGIKRVERTIVVLARGVVQFFKEHETSIHPLYPSPPTG